MKNFKNNLTEITINDKPMRFSDLAVTCMNFIPQGVTFTEMKKNLDIIKKLSDSVEDIQLEDAEHELLLKNVKTFRWKFMHADIIKFCEAVESAK